MSKRKKIVIIAGFCLLLLLTGTLNVLLNNYTASSKLNNNDTTTVGNFYTNYRDRIDAKREADLLSLTAIVNDANTSQENRDLAIASMNEITTNATMEQIIEGLIIGKGFSDAIVICSGSMVTVMVKAQSINEDEMAIILDVVQTQTGDYEIENVEIHTIL